MMDWHHPRIVERLRCFGLSLFIYFSPQSDLPTINIVHFLGDLFEEAPRSAFAKAEREP